MTTLTITLPDPTTDWIEQQVKAGQYSNASAYLSDLVERERAKNGELDWPDQPELTIEDLRRIVEESRASGPSGKTMADIRAEALAIARARGWLNG